jgi:LysM repeat protein
MPYKRLFWIALALLILSAISVSAQSNLLRDPGFEGTYTGRGRGDFNFPEAWGGWWTDSPRTQEWMNVAPNAFPHPGGFKREGKNSLSISRGYGTFTAATYQVVPGVAAGTRLRASAWVLIENRAESGAQVRIGIGAGTDPNGQITWSPWMKTVQSWQQVSVEAVAAGGDVTVFIYATQTWANEPNAVYIDDTSLVAVGTGPAPTAPGSGDAGGGIPIVPTTAPPANVVPFASAQEARPDGSIVHVVQSGDTIASISVAYGVPSREILALNNIANPGLIAVGQQLIIKLPDDTSGEEEPPAETTQEAVQTEEAVTEVAAAATSTSTEAVTPEPTHTPTETPVPPTPTEAPPAPVVSAVASGNPAEAQTGVCVIMFNDPNENRVREPGEGLLAGGNIALTVGGVSVAEHETDGNEPFCFTGLDAGDYTAVGTAPDGYGLTTPRLLVVRVEPGARFSLNFGAKQGLTVAIAPSPDVGEIRVQPETETAPAEDATSPIGLIIFGAAAVVLVGGLGLSLLLRRR